MRAPTVKLAKTRYRAFTRRDFEKIPQVSSYLSAEEILQIRAVASVLPFRVNSYVVDQLIRWENVPEDPLFQLSFPQPGMLGEDDLSRLLVLLRREAPQNEIDLLAREIQMRLNPHPAGQMELNVPSLDGRPLPGMQHKYRETVLFFPSRGQTCHAYCTYCFRWAQFVGIDELKFASNEAQQLAEYVRRRPEVTSVLFTGGDPLIMKAESLASYIQPLLRPELESLTSIRIGTKAPAWWPQRFLTDPDADDLLRLFESVIQSGRHLALMVHFSHPRELETAAAQAAIRRLRETGAVIRCQAPLIRRVNDQASTWADLWRLQTRLGCVPYYLFVERDTGPKQYFEVPLARALDIFKTAYRRVSGLSRTVRGPSMSATPGKVLIDDVAEIQGEKVFVLKMIQGRDPSWTGKVFFARYDENATWLDQLEPAFGESEFFFEAALARMKRDHRQPAWGDRVPQKRKLVLFGEVEWE